ncbi:MAG: hypothetical protein MJ223_03215 [Mycoplasmoidaceae bacterium]|nr:hypothetical protein [Mycoplasmoidaceae bacterium]
MFALIQTPIFKRIAIAFVNNKLARTNGRLFFFLFMLGVLVIGCFTSPTVLFAIMLPILNEIFFLAKVKKGDKLGKYMMLCMCFTIAISSGMTPIAHVFCTSAISAAEKILKYELNFSILKYCAFAIPLGLVAFGIMIGTFLLIIKKQDVVCLTDVNISSIKKSMPAMDAQEIISIIVFSIVIIL